VAPERLQAVSPDDAIAASDCIIAIDVEEFQSADLKLNVSEQSDTSSKQANR